MEDIKNGGERKSRRTNHKKQPKSDIANTLRKSWYRLRLSVRHPARVPTWDAVVLTAASPQQAQLYEWQLNRAKRLGRIAASTVTLAVPDPHGYRIGSGAATLNAIYQLALHYQRISTNDDHILVRISTNDDHILVILLLLLLLNFDGFYWISIECWKY